MLAQILSSPFFLLFGLIALGMSIGAIHVRGFSLSAGGVFFAAVVLGHFQYTVPPSLTEFGLVFFVYSVGLQSGSRFFQVIRREGLSLLAIGLGATAVGAAVAFALAKLLGIAPHLAGGLFAGSTTCTPALAAMVEAVTALHPDDASVAAVGYAVGYPFSVIATVFAVQCLPRFMGTTAKAAAEAYRQRQLAETIPLERCAFRITNPNAAGVSIEELLALNLSKAVICRVEHGGRVFPARPHTILHLNDVVLCVGVPNELAKLETILGTISIEPVADASANIVSELVVVSRRAAFGRRIRELNIWEKYGVTATRLRRGMTEITPHGETALEPGDALRLVGTREDVSAVVDLVGREERRLDETSMIPFAAGIALGALVGRIPIPAPGGLHFQLGIGGGAFLVALLLGHVGHVGPWRLHVPNAAKHFARELGLVIFLAGVGTVAGRHLAPVLREAGVKLIAAGAVITIATILSALVLMRVAFRWNALSAGGALSAVMTSPPGLSAATQMTDCDAPSIGFASVYPVALISKIVLAPLLYLLLR